MPLQTTLVRRLPQRPTEDHPDNGASCNVINIITVNVSSLMHRLSFNALQVTLLNINNCMVNVIHSSK